jgi:excisionase family DNA binding protein
MQQTLEQAPAAPAPVPAVAIPRLWLTVKDLSRLLNMGVRTVWRLVENGQLPQPVRFNRKLVRWDRAELVQFVQDLRDKRPPFPQEGRAS